MTLVETAEAKIAELTAKVNEQQRLIQKLEDDILKVCYNVLCLGLSRFFTWLVTLYLQYPRFFAA